MLSFVLMGYNALLWITNWFFDGTPIDTLLKWLMQIVLFGSFGLAGYYAFLNVMPVVSGETPIDPTNLTFVFELLLAAGYAVFQLLYVISFWFYLCFF